MKKHILISIAIIALSINTNAQGNEDVIQLDENTKYECVPGDIIIKFADNTDLSIINERGNIKTQIATVDAILQSYNVASIEHICPLEKTNSVKNIVKKFNDKDIKDYDLSRLCLIKITDTIRMFDFISEMMTLAEVEFAEPNYIIHALDMIPDDNPIQTISNNPKNEEIHQENPYFDYQSYTTEPMYSMQWGIPKVKLDSLWLADTSSSTTRPIIAILDTGVDTKHPDLADNIWHNANEIANGYDDDNNGFVDDTTGWDFINQTVLMNDYNSHGTHCAGIAAAVGNNNIGICGANPNALIMPISILQSNGDGDIATIVKGINYAKNNGADVISMSFGTYTYSIALEQALAQAYHYSVLVAAAGNDALKLKKQQMFPAAFTFVLGVQATMPEICWSRPLGNIACYSNYDDNGPTRSDFGEEKLYNYEICAPGSQIYSTVPNGMYRSYSGTSMACPLVAGGISALLHAKSYLSQEILWGDLINTSTPMQESKYYSIINFDSCYKAGKAPAQLKLVTYNFTDTVMGYGDNDGSADANEILDIYPTIRTTWGAADSIICWLEFAEFEDTNTVHFINNYVDFGYPLSAYSKSKALNPLKIQIDSNVVNGRIICMYINALSPNAQDTLREYFEISVENGVELKGLLTEDLILYPNVNYIVTENVIVPENISLIIKPGTTIKFENYTNLYTKGNLYAVGKPDSLITFTKTDLGLLWSGICLEGTDTLQYCIIEYAYCNTAWGSGYTTDPSNFHILGNNTYNWIGCDLSDLIFKNNLIFKNGFNDCFYWLTYKTNIYNNVFLTFNDFGYSSNSQNVTRGQYTNFVNNTQNRGYMSGPIQYSGYSISGTESTFHITQDNAIFPAIQSKINVFSNRPRDNKNYYEFVIGLGQTAPQIVDLSPVYLGTSREDIARKYIWDLETPNSNTYHWANLDSMPTRPHAECHGVVWKVLCNGYDAQDEYDLITPLGPSRHRFDIYYNRAMDTSIAPTVTMGIRAPYTQYAIDKDGSWSEDSTIYTVYVDIDATNITDGINRIYVSGGRDNEFFEIPDEKVRFNVPISTAGSLSAGFIATPGFGKIDLEWNYQDALIEDILGYNIYRYKLDSDGNYSDTTIINASLILDSMYTDTSVIPGDRYYYYYKMLRTDFAETNFSRVVSAVAYSAMLGDANGSFTVDIADIVCIISHIANQNPTPFIFDAADVNRDGLINILDIVGVTNIIVNTDYTLSRGSSCETATYNIENNILYIESPVDLSGLQIEFNMQQNNTVSTTETLNEFERVATWISNEKYMFLAYNLNGLTIPAGKHALLNIGDATISDIVLSDPSGCNIVAIDVTTPTGIVESDIQMQMKTPYPNPFDNSIIIPYIIGNNSINKLEFIVNDITGREIDIITENNKYRGNHNFTWTPEKNLKNGIYFIQMRADGITIQTSKIIYNK